MGLGANVGIAAYSFTQLGWDTEQQFHSQTPEYQDDWLHAPFAWFPAPISCKNDRNTSSPGHIWYQEYCYIYTYFVAGELHCLQPFAANNAGTCGIPLQLFSFPEHFPHATTVWERDRPGRATARQHNNGRKKKGYSKSRNGKWEMGNEEMGK